MMKTTCPDCGATLDADTTCETHFHQMLFWEAEFPDFGVVHHLAVLCYHLQHPHLYSPDGLQHALGLLVAFVEQGRAPAEIRQAIRPDVDSGKRDWHISARADSPGAYRKPIQWTITSADVVERGAEPYIASVRQWAASCLDDLKASGNLDS